MKHPQLPNNAPQLTAALKRYCAQMGYVAGDPATRDGYVVVRVSIPNRHAEAVVSFNGELFTLDLPGGYSWTEFAMQGDDEVQVLEDLLAFLDAYDDPLSREVAVGRWLRGPRLELHLSNGAVLRRRGWNKGPPDHER